MTDIVILQFTNMDARPKVQTMTISRENVPQVMAWYGAYYARDRYRVTIDGEVVKKDKNGELVE